MGHREHPVHVCGILLIGICAQQPSCSGFTINSSIIAAFIVRKRPDKRLKRPISWPEILKTYNINILARPI